MLARNGGRIGTALAALTIISCWLVISCVATPSSRFPEFAEQAKNISEIDVLLDIVVSEDIDGPGLGIDLEKHRRVAQVVEQELRWQLQDRGYTVKSIHVNSGLFIDWDELATIAASAVDTPVDDTTAGQFNGGEDRIRESRSGSSQESTTAIDSSPLVYLENGKSTGEAVTGPFLRPDADTWTSSDFRSFLVNLREQSAEYFVESASQGEFNSGLSLERIPGNVSEFHPEKLMVIRVNSIEVRSETSAASGIITGLASFFASGGAMFFITAPVDGHSAEAMVVDVGNQEILWYNFVQSQGSSRMSYSVDRLLKPLPSTGSIQNPVESELPEEIDSLGVSATTVYDLTGEYQSKIEISSTGYTGIFPQEQQVTSLTIIQNGNEFSGEFGSGGLVNGIVDGDQVHFDWYTSSGGTGEWRIFPRSNKLVGTWTSKSWDASGEWSLRKIGPPIRATRMATELPLADGRVISGTYVSEITSSHIWRFRKEAERTMRLKIRQNGKQVIAENEEFELKIIGTRNGDSIEFYALPNKMTQWEITGEWNLTSDPRRLTGNWDQKQGQHPARGEWNLLKID